MSLPAAVKTAFVEYTEALQTMQSEALEWSAGMHQILQAGKIPEIEENLTWTQDFKDDLIAKHNAAKSALEAAIADVQTKAQAINAIPPV